MSDQAPQHPRPVACPFLGLASDPATHASTPEAAHLCHATPAPSSIEVAHQSAYCLTGVHLECPRFLQAEEREVERVRLSALGVSSGREEERLRRGGIPWLDILSRLVAAIVVLLIVGAGALYVAGDGSSLPGLFGPAASQPALSPGATLVANPSAVASAKPVVSVAPPSPTPRSKNVIYVVRQGDTLEKIAAQFGVTIDDIVSANKLKDPNRLNIGQKLVIPPPPEPASGY